MSTMPFVVPTSVLRALALLVERRTGLRFERTRIAEFESRILDDFVAMGCVTWDAYLARLASSDVEALLTRLVDALTIGETYFFRDRPYFDALEHNVLPDLIARRQGDRELRIWSAGCATGEEAYSLAILVRRLLPNVDDWKISILATDINRRFLESAKAGLYSEWSFRETDEGIKSAYFTREGARYRVRPEVRRLVHFAYLNLADDSYPSTANGTAHVDLILCRNVLMYFVPDQSHSVVARLREALAPGGWLVIGASDPLPGLLAGFEMCTFDRAILYRRLAEAPQVWLIDQSHGFGFLDASQPDRRSPASSPTMNAASGFRQHLRPLPSGATPRSSGNRTDVPEQPRTEWHGAWKQACLCADRGSFADAESWCQRAIAEAKFRPEPYYLLGTLRQMQGDDAAALVAFRQALYVDRTFVPAHLGIATVHLRAGRLEQTIQALGRARALLQERHSDEFVLAEHGPTVGQLRDALARVLSAYS